MTTTTPRRVTGFIHGGIDFNILLVFIFGVLFSLLLLALAFLVQEPTPTTFFIFRVVLALAAAGIGAAIPGFITVRVGKVVRAGGALALFVIVYQLNPPDLVAKPTEDADLVERAEAALANGNLSYAITLFGEASQKNPANWRTWQGLGRAEYGRGNFSAARTHFSNALDKNAGQHWSPALALAMVAEAQNDLVAAHYFLKRTLALAPDGSPVQKDVLFDLGRIELSIWLRDAAPMPSEHYDNASHYFQLFTTQGGFPLQWAHYHLACLAASRATDPGLPAEQAKGLEKKALRSLTDAKLALQQRESSRSLQQLQMMDTLLHAPERWHDKAGHPVACPALQALARSSEWLQRVSAL